MFKKTLLAASILLVSANTLAATTTTASGSVDVFGKEYVANETSVTFSDIDVDLDAQYSVGDIVTLTVTGATIDVSKSTATAVYSEDLTASPTMVLGLLSTTATTATFRVTVATGNHGDAEAGKFSKITFSGIELTTATAAVAGNVTATYAAQTSTGISIDSASTNAKVAMKGVNQYNVKTTTSLDAVISVGQLRTNFGAGVYTDTVQVTFSDYTVGAGEATVGALFGGAPTTTKVTLNGDFSFLDTNADGKITATDKIPLATAFAAFGTAGTITPATDLQSVTFVGPAAAFGTSGLTITAGNAAGDTVIKAQSFTVDTEITHAPKSGSAAKVAASAAAGLWKLDGSSTDIAFLPFGSQYAQSITVTNKANIVGNITVTLRAEGVEYSKTLTATAAADSVTNISTEVSTFALASGINGNAAINVLVNAPTADIQVKAVYFHKADADRVLTQ